MFLSPADLQQIKDIFYSFHCEDLPNKITHATIDNNVLPEIQQIIEKYVDLDKQFLKHAFRLNSPIPCQIHSDYYYSERDVDPSIVMLIPFQSDSSTVVFNQGLVKDFKDFKAENEPLADNGIDPVRDGLTHIDPANLAYVSIKSIEKWEEGKIITFDRKLLHCSDDFKRSGVDRKVAAVLWFSYL